MLIDSGARVAELAGEDGASLGEHTLAIERMPRAIQDLIARQVADLLAILQPGLLTLETIAARGRAVGPAARALHREFLHAHGAIVRMVPEAA